MRYFSPLAMLLFFTLSISTVVSTGYSQDFEQQRKDLLSKIHEIDKKLGDSPSPQEYDDLSQQRKEIEAQIKDVTEKLEADVDAMKKINAVKKAYNEGNAAYKFGDYQGAISHYDRAISLDVSFYKAHYGKGLALKKLRKFQEAIIAHQGASKHNPAYVAAYIAEGKILKQIGKNDEALKVLTTAIENNPGSERPYYELGAIYLDYKKDYNKAAANFSKATQLKSDYDLAFYSLGVSLTELARHDEALIALDTALKVTTKKKWYRPHHRKAVIYNKQSAFKSAKTAADEALKLKANFAPAAYEAGKACKELELFDQAVAYFEICKKDRSWKKMGEYEIDLIVNREKYAR